MTLHYFWEGGKKPRLIRKCLASWTKILPQCEIKEWNLEKVKRLGAGEEWMTCPFMTETVASKKWGFVIDIVRWAVLWKEGGVFLDADVEMVNPLPEGIWLSAERDEPLLVNPGQGAAFPPKHPFVRAVLDEYTQLAFDPARTLEQASPYVVTRMWERWSNKEGIAILPARVMNPLGWSGGRLGNLPEECRAIHWYAASWFNWKQRLVYKILPRMGIDVGRIVRWLRK